MKTRFWISVILVVIGAVTIGYSSGHYDGERHARFEANFFLQDFVRSTGVESYLQQRGQSEWLGRFRVYGIGGPTSYFPAMHAAVRTGSVGLICVSVGLIGLLFTKPPPNKSLQATATAPSVLTGP